MSVLYFSVLCLEIKIFFLVEYIVIDKVIMRFLVWFGNLDKFDRMEFLICVNLV